MAACPIGLADFHKFSLVPDDAFLTKVIVEEQDIGPGDEVFVVGRFAHHEGKKRNQPSVRFGRISMMPGEPVRVANGHLQESFLIDAHSIGGYSGSPVFVEVPRLSPHRKAWTAGGTWLLGVLWGHLNNWETICDADGQPHPQKWRVNMNAGLMGVVPAWKLKELLNHEDFVAHRQAQESPPQSQAKC